MDLDDKKNAAELQKNDMAAEHSQESVFRRIGKSILYFLQRVWLEFNRDQCFLRAASLSFSSLLALVPLLAVLFTLMTAFGAFESTSASIEQYISETLIPTEGEKVLSFIKDALENASGIGTLGLIFFIITSILLFFNVENNFNSVWGTKPKKKLHQRFISYATVLVLSSILIAASFSVTTLLTPILRIIGSDDSSFFIKFVIWISQQFFIAITLFLMIIFIPSARVRVKSAFYGALAGSIIWEIARNIFRLWSESMRQYSILYGSFAILPIFLIWLQLTWIIILVAFEISYSIQHQHEHTNKNVNLLSLPYRRLYLGLAVIKFIASRFESGKNPPTLNEIADHLTISTIEANSFINLFLGEKLIFPVTGTYPSFVPSKSIDKISVDSIIRILYGQDALKNSRDVDLNTKIIVDQLVKQGSVTIKNLRLRDLLSH